MSRYFLTLSIFVLCVFTSLSSRAQDKSFQIKGVIIDSLTQKPGEYFTIALKKDSTVIKTVVSDEQGKFTLSAIKEGQYNLIIGSIGYQSKQIPVKITKDNDLGKIAMKPQGNDLNEVAIVASKPIIKQEPDRIVYDTQADPESKVCYRCLI
ncbi:carboxypeptidase-like regulatory domain-containing protein [Pedobacter sp. SL55]|uniref:carboxypeptidase-like regulatory domain-containing protein n=1 Tax=Pedobacter sp. SL55 TaxID=2995161 RepID=UPI00227007F3|nr:carboxypeptidase-like regulatory domain-containing protein [Pedobacter sp. SL55]WAC40426.1 carboxypeptidase-like regulatory domain-containing protein [Pedobacter sp. SL55]